MAKEPNDKLTGKDDEKVVLTNVTEHQPVKREPVVKTIKSSRGGEITVTTF